MNKIKISSILLILTLIVLLFVPKSKAANLTISLSKTTANIGDTVNINVNGNGIAGKIELDVSGNAELNQKTVWVDNSTATVTVKVNGEGTITITAKTLDTSDTTTAQKYIDSTSAQISVNKSESPNINSNTNNNTGNNANTNTGTSTEKPTKSNVATLSNLGIRPNDFTGFRPYKDSYAVEVPNEIEEIEIYANKGQEAQKISGTGKKALKEGINTFDIIVTAEDGKTQKKYKINITRKPKEEIEEPEEPEESEETHSEEQIEQFGLTELKIEGLELKPEFQRDIYEYTIELKKDIDKLDILTVAAEANSNIEIIGNENLVEGENIITIIVNGEDKSKAVAYQIILNKIIEPKDEILNNEQDQKYGIKKIIILSVAGGAIILIVIIFIVIKIRKNRDLDENEYISYENLIDNYNSDQLNEKVENDLDSEDEFYEEVDKKKKHSKGKRFK